MSGLIAGSAMVGVAERATALGPDIIHWADDLGMQHSLPMSPRSWKELIKPAYARILSASRSGGAKAFLHTDGHITDIIPDLIECGVGILNPQDLVNGIGNLKSLAKGRVALNLDIDRQVITPFGVPRPLVLNKRGQRPMNPLPPGIFRIAPNH